GGSQFLRVSRLQFQHCGQNDPVLALFEDTLPVAELASLVADFVNLRAIEKADAFHTLMQRPPVSPGVAIDRSAHPAGDSRHRIQTPQTMGNRGVDQLLQYNS